MHAWKTRKCEGFQLCIGWQWRDLCPSYRLLGIIHNSIFNCLKALWTRVSKTEFLCAIMVHKGIHNVPRLVRTGHYINSCSPIKLHWVLQRLQCRIFLQKSCKDAYQSCRRTYNWKPLSMILAHYAWKDKMHLETLHFYEKSSVDCLGLEDQRSTL